RVRLRVVADVLRLQLPRKPVAEQIEILAARQLDRAALEINDLRALERILDVLGGRILEAAQRVLHLHPIRICDARPAESAAAMPSCEKAVSSFSMTSGTVIRSIACGSRTRVPQRTS